LQEGWRCCNTMPTQDQANKQSSAEKPMRRHASILKQSRVDLCLPGLLRHVPWQLQPDDLARHFSAAPHIQGLQAYGTATTPLTHTLFGGTSVVAMTDQEAKLLAACSCCAGHSQC
jgi:hypothetical protein